MKKQDRATAVDLPWLWFRQVGVCKSRKKDGRDS